MQTALMLEINWVELTEMNSEQLTQILKELSLFCLSDE